jgi:Uma2 family endonuclease
MTVTAPVIQSAAKGLTQVVGLTVEQYDHLIAHEKIAQNPATELIGGIIVRKDRSHLGEDSMTVGHLHAWVIDQLTELVPDVRSAGARLRIQLPIALPPSHEPEPDGAVVRAIPGGYVDRHPQPGDVHCVIEVVDSSLENDRVVKSAAYAGAGIGCYILVNLVDRKIEIFTQPDIKSCRYAHSQHVLPGSMVTIPTGDNGKIEIPASRLIPRV